MGRPQGRRGAGAALSHSSSLLVLTVITKTRDPVAGRILQMVRLSE